MRRAIRAVVFAVAASRPAAAQLPTDEPIKERTVPLREAVRLESESARFRLGPVRLLPKFVVRDVGYNSNVFGEGGEELGDYSGTVGFGFRYLLPVGGKVYVRGDAIPEYTWYRRLSERRFLGGTYRGALLALFNRMSVEAGGGLVRQQGSLNTETLVPVNGRASDGKVAVDVDLLDRLTLTATALLRRSRFDDVPEAGVVASALDRDDRALRAGIRYSFREWFQVLATVEETRSRFESQAAFRDHASRGYLLGLRLDERRFYVELSGGLRTGRPAAGSSFPRYSEPVGNVFVSWFLTHSVELQLTGVRRPVNNLALDEPYFIDTLGRARLGVALGRRFVVAGFAERGRSEFVAVAADGGAAPRARNTTSAWGGTLGFRIGGNLRLDANGERSRYTRSATGDERRVTRLSLGLTYEADMTRYDKR